MMDRLAISARGWDIDFDPVVRKTMAKHHIWALETAPGKIGVNTSNPTDAEGVAYRQFWADVGIQIVAMQSLFFGHPSLHIFGNDQVVSRTIDQLVRMAELAEVLDAKYLVFGAYQARRRGSISNTEADDRFLDYFSKVMAQLQGSNVKVLLEAVPAAYGADYLTTHHEIEEIVLKIGHPQVQMLLDIGAAYTNRETKAEVRRWANISPHIHWAVPGFGRLDQSDQGLELIHSIWDATNTDRGLGNEKMESAAVSYPQISIEMFEHALLPDVQTNLDQLINWVKHVPVRT